jgi:predicted HD superfamily hydrolase involved in NAD metabolism
MYTAAALAMAHTDVDMNHELLSGLLHDCAKCISDEKKLKLCQKYGIELSFYENEHPFILHAKLGAKIASLKFHIDHEDILNSIQFHTTGKAAMSPLQKVIYIADYIEPGRNKAPNLSDIRKIAFSNLDECMYLILKDCLEYLRSARQEIDPMSISAFEYYWNVHNQI